MLKVMIAATFVMGSISTAAAECAPKDMVWSASGDTEKYVLYGSEGIEYGSKVSIEAWRSSKLAWRAKGSVSCSNGAVICYMMMDNASGGTGEDATTDAVMETIDENKDGIPDYVILAALGQNLYQVGGAKVEWFNGFKPTDEDDRVFPENTFKFLSCKK